MRTESPVFLRSLTADGEYLAFRPMAYKGKSLAAGDSIDVSGLSIRQIRNLVRWRKILPAPAVAKPKPTAPKAAIKVKAPKPAGIAAPATPPSAAFHSSESAE